MPTLLRYALLQLPELLLVALVLLLLRERLALSPLVVAGIVIALAAKDAVLYPFVRASYEVDPRSQLDKLVGMEAVVRRALGPTGAVFLQGELWRAEAAPGEALPVPEGARVSVRGGRGLTLMVVRSRVVTRSPVNRR